MDQIKSSTQNQTDLQGDEKVAASRLYAAKISLAINLFAAFYEWIVGLYRGSHAIFADAFHTGSDGLTDLLLISGYTLAASVRYRRWSGAIDKGMSLLIGLMIFLMAGRIAVASLASPSAVRGPFAAATLLAPLIAAKGYVSYFKIKTGKETGSLALTTDGYHSALDSLSTVAVVGSLVLAGYGFHTDRVVAFGIALLIFWVGYSAIAPVWRSLGIGTILKEQIRREVSSFRSLSFWNELIRLKESKNFLWIKRHPLRSFSFLMIGVLFVYLLSGVTVIRIGENGLVFSCGRFAALWEPGLHYAPPAPFGRLLRVRPHEPRRAEIGVRLDPSATAERSVLLWENTFRGEEREALTGEAMHLTGDLVVLNVTAVIHYTLTDPVAALTRIEDVDAVVKTIGQSALTASVSARGSDQVLTEVWDQIEEETSRRAQERLDALESGARIASVTLISVQPPAGVLSSFRDVASAREEKETAINLAQAYRNEELPRARGQSQADTITANAYAVTAVAEAQGGAEGFSRTASVYASFPEAVRFVLFWEKAEAGLRRREKIIYDETLSREPTVFDLYLPKRAR